MDTMSDSSHSPLLAAFVDLVEAERAYAEQVKTAETHAKQQREEARRARELVVRSADGLINERRSLSEKLGRSFVDRGLPIPTHTDVSPTMAGDRDAEAEFHRAIRRVDDLVAALEQSWRDYDEAKTAEAAAARWRRKQLLTGVGVAVVLGVGAAIVTPLPEGKALGFVLGLMSGALCLVVPLLTMLAWRADRFGRRSPRRLHTLNPLDWLRLYVWLFFMPNVLERYHEHFEASSTRALGRWLSATMSLLPLFIPLLAANVGTLAWLSASELSRSPSLLLAAVVVLWLVNGLISSESCSSVVPFIVVFVVAGFVGYGIAHSVAGFMMPVLAYYMPPVPVLNYGMAGGAVSALFSAASVAVAGVTVSAGLAEHYREFRGTAFGVVLGIANGVASFLAPERAGLGLIGGDFAAGVVASAVVFAVIYLFRFPFIGAVMRVLFGLAAPISLVILTGVSFFSWGV